jgi:hypothetical protein
VEEQWAVRCWCRQPSIPHGLGHDRAPIQSRAVDKTIRVLGSSPHCSTNHSPHRRDFRGAAPNTLYWRLPSDQRPVPDLKRYERRAWSRQRRAIHEFLNLKFSRGGLTSKIHALVDTNGLPVHLGLTAGEAHDNRLALRLLSRLRSGSM